MMLNDFSLYVASLQLHAIREAAGKHECEPPYHDHGEKQEILQLPPFCLPLP